MLSFFYTKYRVGFRKRQTPDNGFTLHPLSTLSFRGYTTGTPREKNRSVLSIPRPRPFTLDLTVGNRVPIPRNPHYFRVTW